MAPFKSKSPLKAAGKNSVPLAFKGIYRKIQNHGVRFSYDPSIPNVGCDRTVYVKVGSLEFPFAPKDSPDGKVKVATLGANNSDTKKNMAGFAEELEAVKLADEVIPQNPNETKGAYSARVVRVQRAMAFKSWMNLVLYQNGFPEEKVEKWIENHYIAPINEI